MDACTCCTYGWLLAFIAFYAFALFTTNGLPTILLQMTLIIWLDEARLLALLISAYHEQQVVDLRRLFSTPSTVLAGTCCMPACMLCAIFAGPKLHTVIQTGSTHPLQPDHLASESSSLAKTMLRHSSADMSSMMASQRAMACHLIKQPE